MFNIRHGTALSLALLAASPAAARDVPVMMPIASVLNMPDVQQKLGNSIHLYFATKPAVAIAQDMGSFTTQSRTSIASDTACQRVFRAALLKLEEHARSTGANAIINIESVYDRQEAASETEYACHKGSAVTGVGLRGDFVRLAGP